MASISSDFNNSFDRISRILLNIICKAYWFCELFLEWLLSYLKRIIVRVSYGSSLSSLLDLVFGSSLSWGSQVAAHVNKVSRSTGDIWRLSKAFDDLYTLYLYCTPVRP
ncbi:hypothetical protein J6590_078219 [Homalodisca vitripennis]|nr:hypothetical protein J6590_078219 [Homalodisca vitripennis]